MLRVGVLTPHLAPGPEEEFAAVAPTEVTTRGRIGDRVNRLVGERCRPLVKSRARQGNVGSRMHLVAAAWLMNSLTTTAAFLALLQTANAPPSFLFALPVGPPR